MLLIAFSIIISLFSIAIHEAAHGWVAYKLGDPTAKYEGRLTLNPLKHLDPLGSIFFPVFTLLATGGRGPVFGWAKPVPINPYNFKDQRWGELKVAIAGPASNFLLAFISGGLIRFSSGLGITFLIYPLSIVVLSNLSLAIFNLFPIPPLDGSHILLSLIPESAYEAKQFLHRNGFLLLIIFIFFGMKWIEPLVFRLFYLIIGQPFPF